jgi:hypothetical protein
LETGRSDGRVAQHCFRLKWRPGRACPPGRRAERLDVKLPSFSAQAVATAKFGIASGHGSPAAFSMTDRRFHDETLLNSTNFAGASAWCWNFSTQIEPAPLRSASARWFAIFSAVLPSVHRDENPTTERNSAALHPISGFTRHGSSFRHLGFGEANFSCFNRRIISRRACECFRKRQSTLALLDCRAVDGASYQAARCGTLTPLVDPSRCDGGPT